MMTKEEIIKRIKAYGTGTIAKNTDITSQSLRNILKGKNPSYATIKKLSDYFESVEGKNNG